MTFAIFIILILGLFIGGLNILPTMGDSGTTITNSIILLVGWLKTWDFFLPVSEVFQALRIVLIYELVTWGMIATWRTIRFIRGHSDGA